MYRTRPISTQSWTDHQYHVTHFSMQIYLDMSEMRLVWQDLAIRVHMPLHRSGIALDTLV